MLFWREKSALLSKLFEAEIRKWYMLFLFFGPQSPRSSLAVRSSKVFVKSVFARVGLFIALRLFCCQFESFHSQSLALGRALLFDPHGFN